MSGVSQRPSGRTLLGASVTVFLGEQYEAPRSRTERAYPKLIYYHRADKGGHFAAWERPQIFAKAQGGVQAAALQFGASPSLGRACVATTT